MRLETLLPDSLRSRYSLKLLCVSLGIVLVITAITATTVVDISDRVQTEQLNAIETNAELEARALGQWIDGKQQTVRVLSNHQGIVPANRSRTQSTLDGEMRQLSNETASLSIVERSPASFSNGTRETIIASTERELVGAPLRATDINWKPTVGFNFDGTDDVILSWVYTDNTNRTFVALASPTPDGEHALVAEYQTSIRAEQFTSAVAGTETQVLGGFTAFVLFDQNASSGIVPYEGDRWNTTIGQRINATEPTTELQGSVLTDTAVKGYHSVPGDQGRLGRRQGGPAVDGPRTHRSGAKRALAVARGGAGRLRPRRRRDPARADPVDQAGGEAGQRHRHGRPHRRYRGA
ncbi:MAG: hypothetical protein J07HN6_01202 [Halonotius sp. J07HN6]|nr:MAG: hypothetical protein J07HN6_01202 [Halonotius sp. J07HN6]